MRIVCIGDTHYGLKSAGQDRTDEVHEVMLYAVDYAKEVDADLFIHLGDLGHTANPSSQIHAKWVEVFNRLETLKIQSRFMLGNHDIVNRAGNPYGSLAPLAELKYAYLQPVARGRLEEWGQFPGITLMFMPYVSRANLELEKKATIDEYYEYFLAEYEQEIDDAENLLVFTHLNIHGAKVNDEHILRPVTAVVPKRLEKLGNISLIASGHIHQPQLIKSRVKHIVVGSPICTDFGDVFRKSFIQLDADDEQVTMRRVSTAKVSTPLVQLEYDFVDQREPKMDVDWDEVADAGVKVKIRCTEEQHDMIKAGLLVPFERRLYDVAKFVRPFVVTVVRRKDRTEQLIEANTTDADAVRAWLASRKPTYIDTIENCAMEALEETE